MADLLLMLLIVVVLMTSFWLVIWAIWFLCWELPKAAVKGFKQGWNEKR